MSTSEVYIDLTFIVFIIIGYFLVKHNLKAKNLVVIFSLIGILLNIVLCILVLFIGFKGIFHLNLLGFQLEITTSTKFYFGILIITILLAIPLFTLRTKKAMMEFKN